ncbi:hypothetical protein C8R44DRAFT_733092 [Mycena epipterygia]|nr:hypothetical protein C8R44DRAFT_733092 [Mycena epipterygia]
MYKQCWVQPVKATTNILESPKAALSHPKIKVLLDIIKESGQSPVTKPTSGEYITFKASINNIKFRKGGKVAAPHEHCKNIDFLKSAQFWSELVDGQSRAITDSNQRLYYKLPLQLETHHKVLSWNSERSTLANGINFTARKPLLNILNSADNHIDVLPAIPLPESVPDGEVDLLIAGSVDLNSFNPMAAPPGPRDHGHLEFIESEQGGASSYTHRIAFDNAPGSDIDMPLYTPPTLTQPAPPMKQAVHQTLLPSANPTSASAAQKADRCAVCKNSTNFGRDHHSVPSRAGTGWWDVAYSNWLHIGVAMGANVIPEMLTCLHTYQPRNTKRLMRALACTAHSVSTNIGAVYQGAVDG